ncbi:hypothetical protein Hmuk_0788 [Halomicrobium mukohataei DSM 12286]|uniref:ABC transporter permease subunit n=2 Tax=Halomicrobium mukohataei TaxID=57705 RepID=C7P011_HALMD|nr:hypothetical protein Hmuk_0788 [Halomicrobium mukohataei DSM 12286]
MTVREIARVDLRRARRTKVVRIAAIVLALFASFVFLGAGMPGGYLVQMYFGAILFPLLGIGLAYRSVAGECQSGNVQYLLSLPNDRLEVLLGKCLSRVGIAVVVVVTAYTLVGVVLPLASDAPLSALPSYVRFVALTALFVTAHAGVAVGVSAATRSTGRTLGVMAAYFFLFDFMWVFPDGFSTVMALTRVLEAVGITVSETARAGLWITSPAGAYVHAMDPILPRNFLDPITVDAWFLSSTMATAVLLCWTALPPLICYRWFARADLD